MNKLVKQGVKVAIMANVQRSKGEAYTNPWMELIFTPTKSSITINIKIKINFKSGNAFSRTIAQIIESAPKVLITNFFDLLEMHFELKSFLQVSIAKHFNNRNNFSAANSSEIHNFFFFFFDLIFLFFPCFLN